MLNKKLIAIAIVTLGLVMTVSTFGQDRGKRPSKKNPDISRQDAIIKPMYVANQEEYMAGGIADVRGGAHDRSEETTSRKKQNNSVPKPNAGFFDTYEQGNEIYEGQVKTTSIKSPRDVATGQSNQRTKSNSQNKLGNFEIQGLRETNKILDVINSPRDTASGQVIGIQSAREAGSGLATGRRQYEPIKSKNLGDTGTHEVGHKQRKRGTN